ncbi:MAG: alpha/beta hydrolase [Humibacillus sp.]|nr:alpha/beta hydrolase [Humibacillus sp.]MDN5779192.1 alpha/beta hydrolase [Humibacillus sp.]
MNRRRWWGSLTAVTIAFAVAGTGVAGSAQAQPGRAAQTVTTATPPGDATSKAEERRVDSVPKPKLSWFDCSVFSPGAECATAQLPLDYDQPKGATTGVAVLRLKAKDQKRKIGTLFLNPGGPGGSGVQFAAAAPYFLSPDVVDRFDIVGMDPRGTNFSDTVRCWPNLGAQVNDLSGLNVAFPFTAKETRDYVRSSEAFGRACSTTGKPLSGSMSTAEVARDMDVLRRTFGDDKLTYLGFSYGTYLGNVYANLFPDRVRSVAIDGVLDPVAWAGTAANAGVPQTQRIKSGEGAAKALHEVLVRCGTAGKRYCMLSEYGNPVKTYDTIMGALKKKSLAVRDPESGDVVFTISYADVTSWLLDDLYAPSGAAYVDSDLTFVLSLLDQQAAKGTAAAQRQAQARSALLAKVKAQRSARAVAADTKTRQRAASGFAFPYDNAPEAFQSVLCTDGLNPPRAQGWKKYAANAQRTAPDFGPLWTWASAPCASSTWTVRDEDAYRGGFSHVTANPVLVVGNYWDPATNYAGAVTAARLLPNSQLLSSDSWGHTAYGTSPCVTRAVDRYLLSVALPDRGTRCVGDDQPFTELLSSLNRGRSVPSRPLPPVVPPIPGAVPRS